MQNRRFSSWDLRLWLPGQCARRLEPREVVVMPSPAKAADARSYSGQSRKAWGLFLVGIVVALGTAVVGYVGLNNVPNLKPVSLGEQVAITATDSDTATIFTPAGMGTAPSCRVATLDGTRIALVEPDRYQQSEGLEATYGFPVTSGTTYTVVCGERDQPGQFAVAEVSTFPEGVFLIVGAVGIVLCIAGWRSRVARKTCRSRSFR